MSNPYAPPEDRPRAPQPPRGADEGARNGADDAPAQEQPPGGPQAPVPGPPPGQAAPPPPDAGHQRHAAPQDGARPSWASPRAERPPTDPAVAARVVRLTGTFGLLVVASVLVATLPLPWRLASGVFGLLAVGWGIRALAQAVRAGLRGGLPVALGLGVLVAFVWVAVVGVASVVLWPAQRANQECVARALTVAAHQECAAQLERDTQRESDRLRDRVGSTP